MTVVDAVTLTAGLVAGLAVLIRLDVPPISYLRRSLREWGMAPDPFVQTEIARSLAVATYRAAQTGVPIADVAHRRTRPDTPHGTCDLIYVPEESEPVAWTCTPHCPPTPVPRAPDQRPPDPGGKERGR